MRTSISEITFGHVEGQEHYVMTLGVCGMRRRIQDFEKEGAYTFKF